VLATRLSGLDFHGVRFMAESCGLRSHRKFAERQLNFSDVMLGEGHWCPV
jgi:hypothetical protein